MRKRKVTESRSCIICKSDNTMQTKAVDGSDTYGHWYRYGDGWICRKCYKSHVEYVNHKKEINNTYNTRYGSRRIWWTPENRLIYIKQNLKKNICSWCGKEGKTCLHHEQYHLSDPTKGTIELCVSCHSKHHRKIENC